MRLWVRGRLAGNIPVIWHSAMTRANTRTRPPGPRSDMRIATTSAGLGVILSLALSSHGHGQEDAETLAEAFFGGRNHAPWQAASTCPGENAFNDAVVESLIRTRPPHQTRELINSWGLVPECRLDQLLEWAGRATRILTYRPYASSLARAVLSWDSISGLEVLYDAATDPAVPGEARGGYQVAVYRRLGIDEQTDLYIDTFRRGLQEGLYQGVGMRYMFDGPDPADVAIRVVSAALDDHDNPRAPRVLGRVLGVVTGLDRFGPDERRRVWIAIERRLDSLPPDLRRDMAAYEDVLVPGE